ncbi:hypothetical protein A2V94_07040 [Candidatus Atribacteria bacterium RBG_16_35_8]|nr:MAG: hypothetical protein A2V94_07040 [Candidatus Atribacteria bacterium RBG_16_35_8]
MKYSITNNTSPKDAIKITGITKDILFEILNDVADAARAFWINKANKDRSHLRNDYINAIQPVNIGKRTWTISLLGEVPHIIEDGSPRLDMRTTLLGNNIPIVPRGQRGKHRNKKGGFYRYIPFRHTIPGSKKTIGQAMGSAYANKMGVLNRGVLNRVILNRANKLGRLVYKKAKKLSKSTTEPYKSGNIWGDRLKAGYAPKLKPHHKTDIYAGMVKMSKTYEKATQSQYMTFRTISTTVKEGWYRKEIFGRQYAGDVINFVNNIIPKAIDAYIKNREKS